LFSRNLDSILVFLKFDLVSHRGKAMDEKLQAILDSLPSKTPKAQLEPYRELICEMRRRGWSYREIAEVLAEKCQVQAELGAIYDLVRVRGTAKARRQAAVPEATAEAASPPPLEKSNAAIGRSNRGPRTQVPRERPVRSAIPRPVFVYNENEPLRFVPNCEESQ